MGSSGSGGSAGGNSLTSIGLQGYATMLSAEGTATADQYQAEKLDTAATYGQLKAVQTGGQMSRQLNQTLGNIEAVRAAAGNDPTSPTGAAVLDNAEDIGTQQREITVNSILQQSRQDTADAAYYKQASSDALFAGGISTAAGIAKGIAGLGMPSG